MEMYSWKIVCIVCALLLNATGSLSQLDVCGRAPLNNKIVGGGNAVPGAWPWQVSIQRNGFHICGGSLINALWVLSAAHCFQSQELDFTVSLGMTDLQGSDTNKQQINVKRVINHPDYTQDSDNDIALLLLSAPLTFNNYVRPVCLAATSSDFPPSTKVWVTGWGAIRSEVPLPEPETLQEVQLPIVSNKDCANAYKPTIITNNMICGGVPEGGKDSCQGDSGGPMVIKYNGTWIQAGIVSFGIGCALPKIPGVYARVSEYEEWIKSEIISNQPGFITVSNSNRGSPNIFYLLLSFSIIPFLSSLSNF